MSLRGFVSSPIPDKLANLLEGYHGSKALFAACEIRILDKLHSTTAPQYDSRKNDCVGGYTTIGQRNIGVHIL